MENSTKPHIDINDRVYYEDKRSTRTGTVIDTNYDEPMVAAAGRGNIRPFLNLQSIL